MPQYWVLPAILPSWSASAFCCGGTIMGRGSCSARRRAPLAIWVVPTLLMALGAIG